MQIALLLVTLLAAVVLFSLERLPADVCALGILLFLILTGLLPAKTAFAGFGSEAVVMVMGLLILTGALVRTGATDLAGQAIVRWAGTDASRLPVVVMIAATLLSAFMSNTAATAFLLPVVSGLALRAKVSRAKLLMPLAFASILSSSITLVSTSTNIIVSGLMASSGLLPIGMFELAPVGLPIAVVGLGYMYALGRGLVPDRIPEQQIEDFSVDLYLTEIIVLPDSPLVGKTLLESGLGRDLDLKVVRLDRGEESLHVLQAATRLHKGDALLVEGGRGEVLRIKEEVGIDIRADVELSDPSLHTEDVGLIEAILLPGSPLIGRTLKELRFREQFGLQVLGANRRGETLRRRLSEIRLRMGDLLLVQGDRTQIATLEKRDTFRVLDSIELRHSNKHRAAVAIAIFIGVLVAATLNIVSLPVATLLGAALVFATRCITSEEAYHRAEWRALILIASMLGLGAAMETTGTAEFLSRVILSMVGGAQPIWLLTAFFFLTLLLTQPMSNQAAAVVVLPIAVQTAEQQSLNPRTFAMMVALAASCSFLTPLEPACLLVYGPGHYRFLDFLKVGSLLTLLVYVIAIALVPLLWPVGLLS